MKQLSPKAQATREKILSTANDLFYLHGYHATGLDRIIAAASVTKGNFYYHFKSKEELAVAVLTWHQESMFYQLGFDPLDKQLPPLETLFRLLEGIVAHVANSQGLEGNVRGCFFGNFALEMSVGSEAVRHQVQTIFGQFRTVIRQLLERAQTAGELSVSLEPQLLASIILNLMEGAVLMDKSAQQLHEIHNAVTFIKGYLKS